MKKIVFILAMASFVFIGGIASAQAHCGGDCGAGKKKICEKNLKSGEKGDCAEKCKKKCAKKAKKPCEKKLGEKKFSDRGSWIQKKPPCTKCKESERAWNRKNKMFFNE
ncbi:MAG: hypothetical protein MRY79_07045 [Alphaproteobacteria bacterium]|nr:hypothetical protein [Alphaproteobacteria bacterium]